VHREKGINTPEDLKGRKIGTPGYSSTSLTWIRGMLEDEYGVSPEDIQWVLSNKDSSADAAGKISAEEQVVPDGIHVTVGPAGKDESDLLLSGEVDALFHAAEPKAFIQGNPMVKRLFSDSKQTERDYFNKTGIFPIMHAVAIKTELIEKYPWLPKAVFDAYSKAKTMHYAELNKIGWAYSSLPWFAQEYEETKKLMGENFWPYGIEANRKALETLFRYSYEQGLAGKHLKIEDLFHPSTLTLSE
jgi:4,5-dihydroxyphthalate decarboxylase